MTSILIAGYVRRHITIRFLTGRLPTLHCCDASTNIVSLRAAELPRPKLALPPKCQSSVLNICTESDVPQIAHLPPQDFAP